MVKNQNQPLFKFTMSKEKKILLLLPPFWTPQIPPLGISGLKSMLREHGYRVKAIDTNTDPKLKDYSDRYFSLLEAVVPGEKLGNLYNIGSDVMRNHMMAYYNSAPGNDGNDYLELIKTVIEKTFFFVIENTNLLELDNIIRRFYSDYNTCLLHVMEEEKPDVLGLSVFQDTLAAALFTFQRAKEINPRILTIMGGGIFAGDLSPGSPNYNLFLQKTRHIDKIIIGEGELLLLKLLNGQLPESQQVFSRDDIDGEMLDLTTAHLPDFSDFDLQYYPYLSAYTSRSCPFQCSFCSETVLWGNYRKKKVPQVVEELTQQSRQYNQQLFLMGESLLNPIINDLAQGLIENGMSIYWDGYLRAEKEVCNTENTFKWRRGGFYRARLGLESGSPQVLELMGKKISPEQIKKSVSSLAAAGIKTTTYWVCGHPGESEKNFLQTLDLLEEMKDDVYEAWCSPFYYYMSGQVNSGEWRENSRLLYPKEAADLLIVQTWVLNDRPSRDEAYDRMRRFVDHCKKLGIPNPYFLIDYCKADERWKKLHTNAVPSLIEFKKDGKLIQENKNVQSVFRARNALPQDMSFAF